MREFNGCYIFDSAIRAVAYLHRHNITHRDIKCENVSESDESDQCLGLVAKLCDFGVAKRIAKDKLRQDSGKRDLLSDGAFWDVLWLGSIHGSRSLVTTLLQAYHSRMSGRSASWFSCLCAAPYHWMTLKVSCITGISNRKRTVNTPFTLTFNTHDDGSCYSRVAFDWVISSLYYSVFRHLFIILYT